MTGTLGGTVVAGKPDLDGSHAINEETKKKTMMKQKRMGWISFRAVMFTQIVTWRHLFHSGLPSGLHNITRFFSIYG